MDLNLKYDGKAWMNADRESLLEAGVPEDVIARAIKDTAGMQVVAYAERAGARLVAGLTPRRVAEYRIKEKIAADPDAADPDLLALIDRQAAARGVDRATLLDSIKARAAAYRRITMLIAAMEDEAWAALDAIPEDETTSDAVSALLAGLQAQGEQAIAEARALVEGGA